MKLLAVDRRCRVSGVVVEVFVVHLAPLPRRRIVPANADVVSHITVSSVDRHRSKTYDNLYCIDGRAIGRNADRRQSVAQSESLTTASAADGARAGQVRIRTTGTGAQVRRRQRSATA